ncbi:MAG TPA: VWA domain-containing protein [Solirubrobacteraceae bacterium]
MPEVVAVARIMRAGGARVGTGEIEAAARALGVMGAARTDAYLALRAVLCSRREDLAVFDVAFSAVFGAVESAPGIEQPELPPGTAAALPRTAVDEPGPMAEGDPQVRPAAWSDAELLLDKDFAEYSDAERALARVVVAQLARRGPSRRSRRLHVARHRGVRPDLQRTLRASLRWGGEPLDRRWREPASKPRKLVLVCDVSGSMEPYARVLLQYLHAAVATHRRVEAFAFGTRLTRLTRELAVRDPDRALARAAEAVQDWSGGTRIGHALATLNREQGRRLGRGAVVVILSDGWDRGEPEMLAEEMARLRRSAHRVVWLNPLKAGRDYEPLARGMAAALPHTDHFLAGNSLASLAELALILEETR